MADPTAPRVLETYTLRKFDVAADGTRTLIETITLHYAEDGALVQRTDTPGPQEETPCR